ncbi:hypothetical protein R3P38DRAFT_2833376 [Favolaschia claudopus]|uniref:Uncharacterized protein n=1 Tax=Favolaschia claudopus TaxID=2862362 RepID=A0AAW0EAB6_9AGAR
MGAYSANNEPGTHSPPSLQAVGFALILAMAPTANALHLPVQLGEGIAKVIHAGWQQLQAQKALYLEHTDINAVDAEDFWRRARELGEATRKYGEKLLNDATELPGEVREKIGELKNAMDAVLHASKDMEELGASGLVQKRDMKEDLARELHSALEEVVKELEIKFPPPNEASGHEKRQRVVQVALGKAGTKVKQLCMEHGMDQERVEAYWASTSAVIEKLVVLLGGIPTLLGALLITISLLLIPESFLLRPVLSLFGFGPLGPGKGTAASWAQHVFYGAAVPKGSWFAYLDSVAMTLKPASWWGWVGGLVTGAAGAILFGSCGKRK